MSEAKNHIIKTGISLCVNKKRLPCGKTIYLAEAGWGR